MKKFAITALAICAPFSSFAAVIWDNGWDAGQGGYFSDSISNMQNQFYSQAMADNFTVSGDYNITNITVWGGSEFFVNGDLSNMASFDFVIMDSGFNTLYSGTYSLSDLNISVVGTDWIGGNEYEISLANPGWVLSSGNYYLHVGATLYDGMGDAFYWTMSNTDMDSVSATFSNSPAAWTEYPATQGVAFRVEGEPVPEPATMAVLGLGAAALIRRRRQSK